MLRSEIPRVLKQVELHQALSGHVRSIVNALYTSIIDQATMMKGQGLLLVGQFSESELKTEKTHRAGRAFTLWHFRFASKPPLALELNQIPDIISAAHHFETSLPQAVLVVEPEKAQVLE